MGSWFVDNGFSSDGSGGGSVAPPSTTPGTIPWNPSGANGIDPTTGRPIGPYGSPTGLGTPNFPGATTNTGGLPPTYTPPRGGSGIPLPGQPGAPVGGSLPGTPGWGNNPTPGTLPTPTPAPTTPVAPTSSAGPTLGSSAADDATATAWLKSQGIADADIPYWLSSINSKSDGLQSGNAQYWMDKIKGGQADASGGSAGASAGGLGAFLQPYGQTFTAPTGTDDPGFQFALQQGTDAIQRSAAAKGNLLTGGTAKDLASYTTGAALQDYAGAYNRASNTFNTNYNVFRNNQNDPFSKLYDVTQLGYGAANGSNAALGAYGTGITGLTNGYGGALTGLTTGTGNANATATAGNANNTNAAIGGLGNWFQGYPYGA